MRRTLTAVGVGVVAALIMPGIPETVYLAGVPPSSLRLSVLLPNIVLLVLVGGIAAGAYLFVTRRQSRD